MTIYENVKVNVSMKQVAEHHGLKVARNGMACCPYHDDRHPSLKLDKDYFFCFGCGATGDVIDFVARLYGLGNYEAAQKIEADFGARRHQAMESNACRNSTQSRGYYE